MFFNKIKTVAIVNVGQITYKKTGNVLPDPKLFRSHKLHIFGKQILFFFNLKTAAILDLRVKYGINYRKDPRNELLDTKSHKKNMNYTAM